MIGAEALQSTFPRAPLPLESIGRRKCQKIQTLKQQKHLTTVPLSTCIQYTSMSRSIVAMASTQEQQLNLAPTTDGGETERWPNIYEGYWQWNGHRIRYLRSGPPDTGPPVLCVHGFGANADHFRKNLSEIASKGGCSAWAIDLLGYGYSDKPSPKGQPPNTIYTFETWSSQIRDFITQKMGGKPTALICNSIGGLAGLQAAIDDDATSSSSSSSSSSSLIAAVQVINISLRMLHIDKQASWQRPIVKFIQDTLRESSLGSAFFSTIATPTSVKNVLQQCYGDKSAVDDELIDVILKPGLQLGAVDVFLDFISYSGGPLPEELLARCPVPVSVVWGAMDPWEKVEWGREFVKYASVEEYIELPGVGHCPQDEAPQLVNPVILEFVARHL
jgi:pimeloyl-ACP methyl ester carboxylesterase